MVTDRERYFALIKEVSAYYEKKPPETKSIISGKEFFDFVWCPGLTDEINLWTYWQGGERLDNGKMKTDILLIGQDFGSFMQKGMLSPFYMQCVKSEEGTSNAYIQRITSNKRMSPTDWNLISLFSVLGDEYRADIPDNPKLFFTNLCLGYRSIEKISGGDVSAQMRHDSIYLRRLASIVKPKVIICLGASTFLSAASGLLFDHELTEHYDDLIRVATAYNLALDERKNHFHIAFDGVDCELFTVGHPGFMGISNRNRYSKMRQAKSSDHLRIMKEDWKEIKHFL